MSNLSRRDILRSGGALIVAFTLSPRRGASQTNGSAKFAGKPVDGTEVDTFLAIHPDGSATIFTGKVDLGTGLRIAVRQMAAEELGLRVEKVDLIEGDTLLTPDQGRTGGSSGLTQGGVGVRQAAATAREQLVALAAERLKRPASELVLAGGEVRPKAGGPGNDDAALGAYALWLLDDGRNHQSLSRRALRRALPAAARYPKNS